MSEPTKMKDQPTLEERRRIMAFIMEAGKVLLENGAEVFRVEQTMQHMAQAYQLESFHVFVITNGIFASVGGVELAELRNVPSRNVNLSRVAAVNALSRKIAVDQLPVSVAEQLLADAVAIPSLCVKTRVLASAFGAFSFCFLFGGTFIDAVVSLFAGAALGAYLYWCEQRKVEGLFQRLTGAALVSLFCMVMAAVFAGVAIHTNAAIIGAFMILTPGVAFTMAIRDFVRSDYLSGTIRMNDAVLVATSIAIGAGLLLWLAQRLQGGVA